MKKTMSCILSFCCLLSINLSAQDYQKNIDNALVEITQNKSMEKINAIVSELEQAPQNQGLIVYWKAYAKYKQVIAYQDLYGNDKATKKLCAKILAEATKDLEALPQKNSDDYALLSVIKNLSVSYAPTLKIPGLSTAAKKDAQLAIKADTANIRAYVAAGIQDYYTPALYGGGSKFESYFQKALSLPDQTQDNPYLPSWGREDAYVYLFLHYYKQTQYDKAVAYIVEALEYYPQSPRLLNLSSQLKQYGLL